MKKCFRCGSDKPLDDFYTHKGMKDGHVNKCKECTRADVRENRSARADYYRAYDRQRYDDAGMRGEPNGCSPDSRQRWNRENKNKKNCHGKVRRAIKSGAIIKPSCCSECGATGRLNAHHDDYSRPLAIRWLCCQCHGKAHKKMNRSTAGMKKYSRYDRVPR